MSSLAPKLVKLLRVPAVSTSSSSSVMGLRGSSMVYFSTGSFTTDDDDNNQERGGGIEIDDDDFLTEKPELQLQGVDPRKGWNFRGVHRAILCGKVGGAPVQKILRNGRTVTTFTVGTGGMFDQRLVNAKDMLKPVQWHRIAVHNPMLGAYAVQQLVKNSSVYVEGDIETRVYNDNINGEIKSIPEICVRRDGRIRLIKSGESINNISFDELRKCLHTIQLRSIQFIAKSNYLNRLHYRRRTEENPTSSIVLYKYFLPCNQCIMPLIHFPQEKDYYN